MNPTTAQDRREQLDIVDVREPQEWAAGRIEGAVHIPLGDLETRLDQIDREREIVTVCRSGGRSTKAAELLTSRGFRAESLDGGMQAWEDAGLPVTTPDGQPGTVV